MPILSRFLGTKNMTFSINLSVARYSYANLLILTLALSTPLTFAFAGSRAIDHAPIGVMADHMHKSGEWMVSKTKMQAFFDVISVRNLTTIVTFIRN